MQRTQLFRYGAALILFGIAMTLSLVLRSIIKDIPFIFFFGVVAVTAAYCGLRPTILTIVLSILFVDYALLPPYNAISVAPQNLLVLALFTLVASFISMAYEHLHRAESDVHQQREWLRTTLTSIGDAVIATDAQGHILFMNPVAETLTGWQIELAQGKPIKDVFKIVNEYTRQPVDNPVFKVLQDGIVVGLANHTILIAKDGTEYPIDDSGAPIRGTDNRPTGAVLVFRDVTEQKRQEKNTRFLDEVTKTLTSSLDYDLTLKRICQLVIPTLADWCSVSLLEKDQYTLATAAIAHRDPTLEEAAYKLTYPVTLDSPFPSVESLRSGKPQVIPEIPQHVKDLVADPEAKALVRLLDLKSALHIPLISSDRKIGILTLNITGDNPKRFGPIDLPLAEELGRRVAVAVENARLYREAQDLRQTAERQADRIQRLQFVTSYLSTLLQPSEVAKAVIEQCLSVLETVDRGLVALLVDNDE